MAELVIYMVDVRRYCHLTAEEAKTIRKALAKFDFKYIPYHYGCSILTRDPEDETRDIMVGYLEDQTSLSPFLEIYCLDHFPRKVKAGVEMVLKVCGLGKVKPGS